MAFIQEITEWVLETTGVIGESNVYEDQKGCTVSFLILVDGRACRNCEGISWAVFSIATSEAV